MITADQCRAGRALAGAKQSDLAKVANVNVRTIMDFERGSRSPIPATLAAIEAGLRSLGVVLVPENGGGEGVRMVQPKPK